MVWESVTTGFPHAFRAFPLHPAFLIFPSYLLASNLLSSIRMVHSPTTSLIKKGLLDCVDYELAHVRPVHVRLAHLFVRGKCQSSVTNQGVEVLKFFDIRAGLGSSPLTCMHLTRACSIHLPVGGKVVLSPCVCGSTGLPLAHIRPTCL